MPAPVVGTIAASVAGSVLQGNAQKKAAKGAQAVEDKAANARIAESRAAFKTVQTLMSPYVDGGATAQQGILNLLGIGGSKGVTPTVQTIPGAPAGNGPLTAQRLAAAQAEAKRTGKSVGQVLGMTARNVGSIIRGTGPGGVPTYQVNGKSFATEAEAQAYANSQATGGTSADDAQRAAIDGIKNSSQYDELAKAGEYGILSNASATGGLRGGNVQRSLAEYRPALLQSLIDKQLANLTGVADRGQGAAAGVANAAMSTAGSVGAAYGDQGAAGANAALAKGQAGYDFGGAIAGAGGQLFGSLEKSATPGGGVFGSNWSFGSNKAF